jgi:hypothetical protein
MLARKAVVHGGRIVIDELTDLPEGAVVDVTIDDDGLDAEERAALHAALDRALDDAEANRSTDAWTFLKRHRAARANRPA